ncbi:MAG: hypothetical protein NT001_05620 [Candidatus Woesearchaeota archaeon]|nr:hypothetical protein [Candidatus Woesearchaeota archaeon]
MQDIAKSHSGECLSTAYIASDVKLKFRCRFGHIWEAIPDNIIQDHWCPKCNKPEKLNIELFKEIAKSREGLCLSNTYIDNQTKLRFRCKKGHEWDAAPSKIKSKQWCPKCAGNIRFTLDDIQKFAESKEWDCLSTIYQNNQTKLTWRCKSKGHIWIESLINVMYKKQCPICKKESK